MKLALPPAIRIEGGMNSDGRKGPRWWPLIAIWAIGFAAIGYAVATNDGDSGYRQALVMKTIGIGMACFVLSILWLAAFSRIRAKVRLLALGAVALVGVLFVSTVRYGGVSGDLVPIFTWKWSKAAAMEVSASAGEAGIVEGEFPQFLGPSRNAHVDGVSLQRNWEEFPPERLWRQPIGEAWSGFAIVGDRAVTQEQEGSQEVVTCLNLTTGETLWKERNDARYDNPLGGVGPRATPTIDGERVYTVGATGFVACRDLASGELVFSFNLLEDNDANLPEWGVAGSPLVFGDLLILSAGGRDGNSLVAYDKRTGDRVWSGGSDRAHWSSPVVQTIGGVDQILIFNKGGVAAHDSADGQILWEFPWKRSPNLPRVSIPVRLTGDRFAISSGYGAGAAMFEVSKVDGVYEAIENWITLHLKAKFNNFVSKDGYLYGLDDGMMTCIDAETGRRTWKKGRYGHGQLLLGDDWLLVMTESGEAILMDPNPEEPTILGSFQALEGKSWNPPALVGPYLLVRNHLEAACYRLPVSE